MNPKEKQLQEMIESHIRKILKEDIQNRPLYEIAQEIYADWHPVSPYALPYLDAMSDLDKITDKYLADSGTSIVAYFLSNATTWKGEKSREIKKELNLMLKNAYASKR